MSNLQTAFWGGKFHEDKLGYYVYALVDPRDDRIFYIGKAGGKDGLGNSRPNDHLKEAQTAQKLNKDLSKHPKLAKIIEINGLGKDVELIIIRRNLKDEESVHDVEAAFIDLFDLGIQGPHKGGLANKDSGRGQSSRGIVTKENLFEVIPVEVSPKIDIPHVWIFNIDKATKSGKSYQDAVSGHWVIDKRHLCQIGLRDEYGVGLVNGIAKVVVKINAWFESQLVPGRKIFDVQVINDEPKFGNELYQKDFSKIVSRLPNWGWGNKIKVEFVGGNPRILIGKPKEV
ncbi:LEM-3-like GIY-YIG domain-containing protein [Polynucleobacter ibericus]|uniref:LEM-3-like GIY-YIG domain-containing protein n=1 Tax=Polynucleobacter ibericus TaxID=1819725 RepID=UPI001BFD4F22|nr:hypothetical protein [Polynucleobacter ibericus]QWE07901.1 hypothetical protein AOC20_05520 [Polynucleobacter ibericus]